MRPSDALCVIIAILLVSLSVPAWALEVDIYTDEETYEVGDTVEVSLSAENGDSREYLVDLYVGLFVPDGTLYVLSPDGWSTSISAWMSNISVPGRSGHFPWEFERTPLFWFEVPCASPPSAGKANITSLRFL